MHQADQSVVQPVELDPGQPIWEQFYWVAPLVLVGTLEADGGHDLAPKHMALPMGWENYYGFVCTPRHGTYHNARRTGAFTVSFPWPDQILQTSLAAAPRFEAGEKPSLGALPVTPAKAVDGVLVEGAYLQLECRLHRIYDDFGVNSLVTGEVVRAVLDARAERLADGDDAQLLYRNPLLAYLHPGRFAVLRETQAFPFPAGMKK
ncbi:MAG: flavin reductase [Xanthomonadales bacterium]|jgi:flavin reductase (DIM6/NTAB) family NADH-FMN oxidoreductase RutF|nr:flavin reductase [Xanthomonadales bacterium]